MRLRSAVRTFVVALVFLLIFYTGKHIWSGGDERLQDNFNSTAITGALHSLCDNYSKGLVSGDFCNRLCWYSNFTVVDLRPEGGSKVVIVLKWNDQKLILKAQTLFYNPPAPGDKSVPDFANDRDFMAKVIEVVNFHLALDWPVRRGRYLLEALWPSLQRTNTMSIADRRSLWSLVTQDEYITYSVLSMAQLFPKIMGSCGHYYATEYIIPFKLNSYFYGSLRAKILVHLSGTLKLMSNFLNEPLHWCDVKFESLGLSPEYPKRFMLNNADWVFTDSRMTSFFANLRCRTDEECRLYDCTASCIKTTQRCSKRINDNIEVFCKKLIYELYGNFYSKQNKILEICHNLDTINTTQRLTELQAHWVWTLSDI